MRTGRRLAAAVALWGVAIGGLAGSARPGPAEAAGTAFRCTNRASGASWTIVIDFVHGTVDGYPATVGGRRISWHDTADHGFYTLDQVTGDLKIVRGSSMGGWELHALCRER